MPRIDAPSARIHKSLLRVSEGDIRRLARGTGRACRKTLKRDGKTSD